MLTLLLSACGGKEKPAPPPPPPKVVAMPVLQKTVPIIMQHSGTVKGSKTVVIKPRVSGYIQQRLFTEGSSVKAGDPLYQIDPRPFQAQLNAAKAQMNKDQASLNFWNGEVKRYNTLAKKGFVSKEKRDSAVSKRNEFVASVAKDKADAEQARLDLEYCSIVAPFDGYIQDTKVYKGAVVSAQTTELTILTLLDPVYVYFNMSRLDTFTVQELSEKGLGPKHRSDVTATLTMPDGTVYPEQGHVDYTSGSYNPDTDTMTARAIFPNRKLDQFKQGNLELMLIPGQYVPINLTVGKLPDALLIPQTALLETQLGSFVYVLGKDNKVEQRMVTKGFAYQQYWVIKKGLKSGETVISQGLQKIRKSGVQVQPVKPAELKETKKTDAKKPAAK
ncbi:efflux RND transporter periplasmic adaptor subunit [Methyloprofundus sp.]|uniref:efflux RND transporter periplasmic adaptor subunit n=1 Tax=Methyloprofundus sp. TaxID=2020875 RepID=UPI003D0CC6E5